MAWSILGYTFTREPQKKNAVVKTFVDRENDDGSFAVISSSAFASYSSKTEIEDGSGLNEQQLIDAYRAIALLPEVDWAIEEIINEAIIQDKKEPIVKINLDNIKLTENIKKDIHKAFEHVLRLLDFKNHGLRIFRRWYIDGKVYYHAMIDEANKHDGIKEVRYVDPRRMKRIREVKKPVMIQGTIQVKDGDYVDYYLYQDIAVDNRTSVSSPTAGIKVTKDSIASANSGILDSKNIMVLSHLHKALRIANQLSMLESAVVIYRLSRAPERRVFYVDVGNLPPARIEQYMNYIMNKYKTKISYDSATGAVKDSKRYLSMTEDFWMPRREGSQGTQIDTLPAGENLGKMEDVEYFQKKLYKALNIPFSRATGEGSFSFDKSSEISRDEARFAKFITRLRADFARLFEDLLGKQLVLTGVMTLEEWDAIRADISYDYHKDNYFEETLSSQVMTEQLEQLAQAKEFVGTFFSTDTIFKKILKMNDKEIREEKERMRAEKDSVPPTTPDGAPAPQPDPNETQQPLNNSAAPIGHALIEAPTPSEEELTQSLTELVKSLTPGGKNDGNE